VRSLEAGRMKQQASKATNSWHSITVHTGACLYGTAMYGANICIYIYRYNKKSNNQRTVCNVMPVQTPYRMWGFAVWLRSGSSYDSGRSPSSHFQKATPSPVSIHHPSLSLR